MYRACPACGSRLIPMDDLGEKWSCPVCEVTTRTPLNDAARDSQAGFRENRNDAPIPAVGQDHGWYNAPPPPQAPWIPPPGYRYMPPPVNMGYTAPYYHPSMTMQPGYGAGTGSQDLGRRVSAAGLFLFYIIILFNVIALCYALFIVPPEIFSEEIRPLFFVIPIPPFLTGLDVYISGYPAVFYFLMIAAAIFFSLEVLVFRDGRSFFHISKKLLSDSQITDQERSIYDDNGFVLIGELFMANIFFNIAYIILIRTLGIEMDSPDFDEWHLWEMMVRFAIASVWEEVISRMILIGIPLLGVRFILKRRGGRIIAGSGSRQIKDERFHNYLLGGGFEITPLTAGLIVISSLLFGLAHMSSWDAYKVVPTFVGGLIMGYLFVRKGIHASIIFHFAIDYLLILSEAVGSTTGDVILGVTGLFLIVLFSLGGYMLYKYALRLHDHMWVLLGSGVGTKDKMGAGKEHVINPVIHGSEGRKGELPLNPDPPIGSPEPMVKGERVSDSLPGGHGERLERPFEDVHRSREREGDREIDSGGGEREGDEVIDGGGGERIEGNERWGLESQGKRGERNDIHEER